MNRPFLRTVAGVLMGVLLLAQMAVAAYVCPGAAHTQTPFMERVDTRSDAAAPCESMGEDRVPLAMDSQNANLCAEHCKFGQQSDQASTLTAPAALLVALYVVPPVLNNRPLIGLRPAATTSSALVAASPPHTVLHCCFRI